MSKGQETRARIVAKAAPLFNQRGLEGTSMSALMEATGLEKGGIYRHFPSKEAVAAEAFDYAWKLAIAERRHNLDEVPNSVDKLKQFIANFVHHPGPVPGGCPLLNSAIDSDDGNPILRKKAERALNHWRDFLTSIVKSGIKKSEIDRHVDANHLATLVIASLEGALMIARLTRDREALRSVQEHLSDFLEKNVRIRNAR
jgi:TetR/AcrR family transcriptional regulator, transcriptional repressor for nem operon